MSSWTSGEILSKDKLNEMEDNLSSVTSTYNKTIWNDEDIVTVDKLNNLENGISTFIPTYSKHTWVDDEEITAVNLNNIDITQKTFEVGDVIVKDGIESVCVYKEETRQDWGQYLFVDKNHDLVYYFEGRDYVDSGSSYDKPINSTAKYGYEWGGFGIETGITFKIPGKGLSNTNSLIEMNLQPDTLDWPVLWNKVEEFRSTHSNDWFIPSANELSLIYFKKNILNNLSTTTLAYYWSSSEESKGYKFIIFFGSGNETSSLPISHTRRARLCFYL